MPGDSAAAAPTENGRGSFFDLTADKRDSTIQHKPGYSSHRQVVKICDIPPAHFNQLAVSPQLTAKMTGIDGKEPGMKTDLAE